MRNILAAAALVSAGLAGSAAALPVTLDFVATGFTGTSASLLAAIGSDPVTGRITIDEASGFISSQYLGPDFTYTSFRFQGSISVTVNGTTYVSTPPITVLTEDTDNFSTDYIDTANTFNIADDLFLGPGGVAQSLFGTFFIGAGAFGANYWDGALPTAAQLNAFMSQNKSANFSIGGDFVRSNDIVFSSPVVAPIPLPAGGVLLESVIAGLALMSRRRA